MRFNFSKRKLTKEQKKLFETLVFLLKIIVFAIPLYIILTFHGVLYPLQNIVSQNVFVILKLIGFEAAKHGFVLDIQGANAFTFLISEDCTGWKSMLFLTALIIAVPRVLWKKRLIGLIIGIPVIYLGNILRILLIVNIEQGYGLEIANIVHDYLWQAGLISLVLLIWVLWLIWVGKIKTDIFKR